MSKEIWKDVPGYEGLYKVSNKGRAWSKPRMGSRYRGIMKLHSNKDGYLLIQLFKDGKRKTISLHRLIGLVFVDGYQNGYQVNHKNGIKTDNRVENLEWISQQDNLEHARRVLGLRLGGHTKVRCVETGEEFYAMKDAAKKYGISYVGISYCCSGKNKTAAGFHWEKI